VYSYRHYPIPRQSHQTAGALSERVYLPQLFGQVVAGVLLRNAPFHLDYGLHISMSTAGVLKKLAFASLLLKAGISMDVTALKRAKCRSGLHVHLYLYSNMHTCGYCAGIIRNVDGNVDESRPVRLSMAVWCAVWVEFWLIGRPDHNKTLQTCPRPRRACDRRANDGRFANASSWCE
jgi:hypothetical protein